MSPSKPIIAVKLIVSAITLFYGIVPIIADYNETHILSPQWSQHARFHGMWFLSFTFGTSFLALYLIWLRDELLLAISIGLLFVSGFWLAALFKPFYGGELVDTVGQTQRILGFDANVIVFSSLTFLLLGALIFLLQLSEKDIRRKM